MRGANRVVPPSEFAGASRANESEIEDGALRGNVRRRLIRKVVRGGAAENEPPATPEAAASEAARRGVALFFPSRSVDRGGVEAGTKIFRRAARQEMVHAARPSHRLRSSEAQQATHRTFRWWRVNQRLTGHTVDAHSRATESMRTGNQRRRARLGVGEARSSGRRRLARRRRGVYARRM